MQYTHTNIRIYEFMLSLSILRRSNRNVSKPSIAISQLKMQLCPLLLKQRIFQFAYIEYQFQLIDLNRFTFQLSNSRMISV